MKFFMACMLGIGLMAAPAMAQDMAPGSDAGSGADTNLEIFYQKIKADKKLLVASNMDLSEAEGKKFWPLSRLLPLTWFRSPTNVRTCHAVITAKQTRNQPRATSEPP